MRVSSSEWARIDRIRALLSGSAADVELGIGDDCAVLAPTRSRTAVSIDAQVEGVHFRRAWASMREIGHRAAIAALSDLAAMGARPRHLLSALVLPGSLDDDALDALVSGIGAAAKEHGALVVGGNLARGSELSITTTVMGALDGAALTRAGARPGDGVYVTGTLGAAGLGLAALLAERAGEPLAAPFVSRWRTPRARVAAGLRLAGVASAAIDVSDGLLSDASHVARASGVGIEIEAALLPREPGHDALAAALGVDGLERALAGGEDYELLFTASDDAAARAIGTRIGVVVEGAGEVIARDAAGRAIELASRGFSHFG